MKPQELINRWKEANIITGIQAELMLCDLRSLKKEQGNNKFFITISVIGSILLGIGILLFIASNWWLLPKYGKIAILMFFTFGSHYAGYYMAYQKKNFPKIGFSLIFLSTIIFGATLILISQIYNTSGDIHSLVLIWLFSILPLVYVYRSRAIAILTAILYTIWSIWYFGFQEYPLSFYLVSSLFIFAFGSINYIQDKYYNIARSYRLYGLICTLIILFILSFKGLSEDFPVYSEFNHSFILIIVFSVLSAGLMLFSGYLKIIKSSTSSIERAILILILVFNFIFITVHFENSLYPILFNLLLFGILLYMFYYGYSNEDMKVINSAAFFMVLLILARYFDFFWDLLPRSVFFIIGGLILLMSVYMVEKQNRKTTKRLEVK